jgi:hypothetical protein
MKGRCHRYQEYDASPSATSGRHASGLHEVRSLSCDANRRRHVPATGMSVWTALQDWSIPALE